MDGSRLSPDWPTRLLDVNVGDIALTLRAPDNTYAMLDLPAVAQAFNEDEYMPYWATLWPASMMLADWLARSAHQANIVQPPGPVLEIGCGLAVVGLLAARLGYDVTVSDYDPDAVQFAARNAAMNGLHIRAQAMDWRRPSGQRYPLILGADVLYEQRTHQPILEFLRQSLTPDGTAVISDPNRRWADNFVREAPSAGWRVVVLPARWEDVSGRILRITRNAPTTSPRPCSAT